MKFEFLNQENEFSSAIKSFGVILKTFNTGIAVKYIENISYLSTLFEMEKIVEFGYLSIVFGLILLEFHESLKINTPENQILFESCKKLHSVLTSTHSKLSKLQKAVLTKIQNETQKIFLNCKHQVSISQSQYPSSIGYKINLFSSIIQFSSKTVFQLSLSAFLNTYEQTLTSTIFPKYTNSTFPYLPSYKHKSYTLVLDLDETLVHKKESEFLIRPGATEFLETLNKHYEIVIFTAASPMHADEALKLIDPNGEIKLRLYKNHTVLNENSWVKDLEMLGRDLDKTLIVDNMPENFKNQDKNGIAIESWTGNLNDQRLNQLRSELEKVSEFNQDIRDFISSFRNFCN